MKANPHIRITVSSLAAGALVLLIFFWLRSVNASSEVYLADIRTAAVSFQDWASGQDDPIFNETATAQSVVLTGFRTTFVTVVSKPPNPQELKLVELDASKSPIVLTRIDQLHLKDFFPGRGTLISVVFEQGVLSLVFENSNPSGCCRGRIGVGDAIYIQQGSTGLDAGPERNAYSLAVKQTLHPMHPHVSVSCPAPPCSLVIRVRQLPITNFVSGAVVRALRFDRANTASLSVGQPAEFAIQSGTVSVGGVDLLNTQFILRKVVLATATGLIVSSKDNANITIDLNQTGLLVNASIPSATYLAVRRRSDELEDLLPSVLEISLKEPWHKSLATMVAAAVPVLLQFFWLGRTLMRKRRKGK